MSQREASVQDDVLTHYGNDGYISAAVGTQFDDPRTYADVIRDDGGASPTSLLTRGMHQCKGQPVPYEVYYDPQYVAREVEHVWLKYWQVACREEDLPKVGDRLTYDVGPLSFLVVRTAGQQFKAFFNSCRHRGRRLCNSTSAVSGDSIQCQFHAWTYGLDGKLKWVPRQEEFPGVSDRNYSLREVKCESWGGNVFINPDPKSQPLKATLGVMVDHFKEFPVEERYTAVRIRKRVSINWKAAMEAFLEAYHVLTTHPSGMPMFGSTYTAIDVWDDGVSHVNRLITPMMPDGWVRSKVPSEVGLRLFCNAYGYDAPPAEHGGTVKEMRAFAADRARERIKAESGIECSDRPVAFMVDMVQWFSFPNFFPWWGEGLAWWYNFTPLGENPNECMMDLRFLKPAPKNGPRPASAKAVEIDFDDLGRNHPETGQLGYVMDEDMDNMLEVQKGMRTARGNSAHAVLSMVQEARVRHFQETYARAIGLVQKAARSEQA
jgi:phenylpropionate dioxygenase-like ring-hydroxylating dioxygenase large terminal subunit